MDSLSYTQSLRLIRLQALEKLSVESIQSIHHINTHIYIYVYICIVTAGEEMAVNCC